MNVEKFKVSEKEKLSKAIQKRYPTISYSAVQKLLRNKDVKIDGKRVSEDVSLDGFEEVCFYIKEDVAKPNIELVYRDENLVVVFKRRNIETISENEVSLQLLLKIQLGLECYAVHRLDRNTEGLVVFALNLSAKELLDDAFKNRTIDKYYLAEVYGVLEKDEKKMIAYLKKDSKNSLVYVSDVPKKGFEKIQTNYKLLLQKENSAIVEVELVSGKTHQIRAHFAHIGHFVVGDEKYGNSKINKLFKRKYQSLCAYKIIFHFNSGVLKYLNNKEICLDKSKIDFCQNL